MTNEEEKIRLGLADINGIAAMIRDNLTALSQLSSVTKSKAAETDRLTDENRALRVKVDDFTRWLTERDSEIARLDLKVAELEAKLAEHKRLAQEKVDALEELLSKATLPEEEPEAPKAPAVEVMPGPDYVTRAELRTALAAIADQFGGPVHDALRHVAHELVKP